MNLAAAFVMRYQDVMKNSKQLNDEYFMSIALKEARKAYQAGEVPIGAVLVYQNNVVVKGYNMRKKTNSVLSHAEVNVIKKANNKLKTWMLDDYTLYVTIEPCLMCAGIILQSRIKRVVYAAKEPKFGSFGSIIDISSLEYKFNHHIEITQGILNDEAASLMKQFFKEKRQK
jgi:tRNA(adenine34) deaminase